MRKMIVSMLVAAGLAVGAAASIAAEEGAQAQQPATGTYNMFDPSAWTAFMNPGATAHGAQPGQTMAFNPANPAGWAMFIDPRTHEQAHMAFMNPGQYAQFMSPQFYMQWMNPAAYTMPTATAAAGGMPFNFFDPNAWAQMMPAQPAQQ